MVVVVGKDVVVDAEILAVVVVEVVVVVLVDEIVVVVVVVSLAAGSKSTPGCVTVVVVGEGLEVVSAVVFVSSTNSIEGSVVI